MNLPELKPPILFISDVHLGGFSDEKNRSIESELIQLINYCQRNGIRIAILGDLFDYWMEYPNYTPKLGRKLLNRFEQFNNSLGPTLFITGNHDYWTRNYLPECGFYLEHEQYTFSLDDHKIMTLHGDGLSNPSYNLGRPFMHRILRDEQFIKIFQTIFPPRVGITIMKYFSYLTRHLDWNKNKEENLNRWSQNKLANSDIDIILCGHDHIPRKKQFTFGTYINSGSFYKHRTMAFYNNSAISLVKWKVNTQSLNQVKSNYIDE